MPREGFDCGTKFHNDNLKPLRGVLEPRMKRWGELKLVIGEKLKALREQKNLSQGDIEKRTGLMRCYISPVENGHTVPAIETLEKVARALEVPIYALFYDGEGTPQGAVVSPLLANVYLHYVFDLWIEAWRQKVATVM